MPFLLLSLDIGSIDPEPIEAALFDAGALSITLKDAADSAILEPGPGETPLWPSVSMSALFSADTEDAVLITRLRRTLSQLPPHRFETIEDRVWEREWLKDFKPMRFGERLWICPGGMEPISDEISRTAACLIRLDPGLAFGTGTHPTTALCLEWLDSADLANKTVIDYGCGSGILAIAALVLGAKSAVGIDIDPQALVASRDNANRNEVSNRLDLQGIDAVLPTPSEVVLANILAGPLHDLASTLASLVRPRGSIVLSGILREQAADLARRYAAWFDMDVPVYRDDWVRLTGNRRA
jgi:ribosomal protein L11 methyltransferase